VPGSSYCAAHRAKRLPEARAREARRRDDRRAAGLCLQCGREAPEEGRTKCATCAGKANSRKRAKRSLDRGEAITPAPVQEVQRQRQLRVTLPAVCAEFEVPSEVTSRPPVVPVETVETIPIAAPIVPMARTRVRAPKFKPKEEEQTRALRPPLTFTTGEGAQADRSRVCESCWAGLNRQPGVELYGKFKKPEGTVCGTCGNTCADGRIIRRDSMSTAQ
jgi:hypothetical protein